jgi:hypothetical protein
MKKLIPIDEAFRGLDLGYYGEYLNDYRESNDYLCDIIVQIADNNTSIYYYDIIKFISENVEEVNDVINEFGWEGAGADLYKAGQLAECLQIERELDDVLIDSLILCAKDYIKYDLQRVEIPEELPELIEEWAEETDTNDRMSDFIEKINNYFEGEEE